MLKLDTHILIYALRGDVSARERPLLTRDKNIRRSRIVPLAK